MTSENTTPDTGTREVPSLGEIRFCRLMRLVCGLAVWPVGAFGLVRIAESGGDFAEVVTAIVAVSVTAAFCAFAGVQVTQLQTARDEATAPSSTNQ